MTPEQWEQIRAVLEPALELAPDERTAFVERTCGDQGDLRSKVESLLTAYERGEDLLEIPATDVFEWSMDDPVVSLVGWRVGAYEVVEEIGRGGMSTVYLAARADGQFQQRVALKVLKPGVGCDDLVHRFKRERQLLASFKHPNIARLLDGGTTGEGQLYLVLEYVEGTPIDVYCDTNCLSTVERLRLFVKVCSAVSYAHQNMVVHRDLKPTNILVTPEGVPKLLDFGIAKLLDPDLYHQPSDPTMTALRPMTPRYASPEQAKGEAVSTVSDVYSLGVLLYELLTGRYPYRLRSDSPHELLRAIHEEEPEKPSSAIGRTGDGFEEDDATPDVSRTREGSPGKLRRRLVGDVDNIVLTALRKEPERRYASVEQFSEDIRRHLEGLPVRARRDTFWYRATKFTGRNKVAVIAAGLIAVTLLGGITATSWQANVAERRFNDVRKLANSNLYELDNEIVKLPGATPVRKLLVTNALEYLNSLSREVGSDVSLRQELATAYQKVGDIQGNPFYENLGDTAGALASFRKSVALREALASVNPLDIQIRRDLATGYDRLGDVSGANEALANYRRAFAIRAKLTASKPDDAQIRRDLMLSFNRVGEALWLTGDRVGAAQNYKKGLEIAEELTRLAPGDARARGDLWVSYIKTGDVLAEQGDQAAALKSYDRSLQIVKASLAKNPTDVQTRHDLSLSYGFVGSVLKKTGDLAHALENHQKALTIARALSEADPLNAQFRRELSVKLEQTGDVLMDVGDLAEALKSYRESLTIRKAMSASDPASAELKRDLADIHTKLGDVHVKFASRGTALDQRLDTWRTACSWYGQSTRIWLDLRQSDALRGRDTAEPEKVDQALVKCERALARLAQGRS